MISLGTLFGWVFAFAAFASVVLAITFWPSAGGAGADALDPTGAFRAFFGAVSIGSALSASFFSWVSFALASLLRMDRLATIAAQVGDGGGRADRNQVHVPIRRSSTPAEEWVSSEDTRVRERGDGRFVAETNDGAKLFYSRRMAEEHLVKEDQQKAQS